MNLKDNNKTNILRKNNNKQIGIGQDKQREGKEAHENAQETYFGAGTRSFVDSGIPHTHKKA